MATLKRSREFAVCTSIRGVPSIRHGQWKYIPASGSGGWGNGGEQSQSIQLYDLVNDIGETQNLEAQDSERVRRMQALLEQVIVKGRSTPGPALPNDVKVRRYIPKP